MRFFPPHPRPRRAPAPLARRGRPSPPRLRPAVRSSRIGRARGARALPRSRFARASLRPSRSPRLRPRRRALAKDAVGRRRVFDSGELQLVLLKLIADQPRHGYELIRAIEELTGGAYVPSPGVIYPTLTLLQDMGRIEEATAGRSAQGVRGHRGRHRRARGEEAGSRGAVRAPGRARFDARADRRRPGAARHGQPAHRAAQPARASDAVKPETRPRGRRDHRRRGAADRAAVSGKQRP